MNTFPDVHGTRFSLQYLAAPLLLISLVYYLRAIFLRYAHDSRGCYSIGLIGAKRGSASNLLLRDATSCCTWSLILYHIQEFNDRYAFISKNTLISISKTKTLFISLMIRERYVNCQDSIPFYALLVVFCSLFIGSKYMGTNLHSPRNTHQPDTNFTPEVHTVGSTLIFSALNLLNCWYDAVIQNCMEVAVGSKWDSESWNSNSPVMYINLWSVINAILMVWCGIMFWCYNAYRVRIEEAEWDKLCIPEWLRKIICIGSQATFIGSVIAQILCGFYMRESMVGYIRIPFAWGSE